MALLSKQTNPASTPDSASHAGMDCFNSDFRSMSSSVSTASGFPREDIFKFIKNTKNANDLVAATNAVMESYQRPTKSEVNALLSLVKVKDHWFREPELKANERFTISPNNEGINPLMVAVSHAIHMLRGVPEAKDELISFAIVASKGSYRSGMANLAALAFSSAYPENFDTKPLFGSIGESSCCIELVRKRHPQDMEDRQEIEAIERLLVTQNHIAQQYFEAVVDGKLRL